MREGWILVYASSDVFHAKMAEDILKQNGIESHMVSKPDSVLPSIGEAELYTLPERAEQALKVLRDHNMIDRMEA